MGSTGMLNKGGTRAPISPLSAEKTLFRSCSTSQLSASYIRGDDPADCLDPSLDGKPSNAPQSMPTHFSVKTLSVDNLADISKSPSNRRAHFPYAFLRSKLSVLPEENGGSVVNHKVRNKTLALNNVSRDSKMKKANSEECFSTLLTSDADVLSLYEVKTLERRPRKEFKNCYSNDKDIMPTLPTYVNSSESGYDSDGNRQCEENKRENVAQELDGDSGIVANESSDTGSLHESESGNETPLSSFLDIGDVHGQLEIQENNDLNFLRRPKFLPSEIVEAKPCVVYNEQELKNEKEDNAFSLPSTLNLEAVAEEKPPKSGLYLKNTAESRIYSKHFSRDNPMRSSYRRFSECGSYFSSVMRERMPSSKNDFQLYRVAKVHEDEVLGIQLAVKEVGNESRYYINYIDPAGAAFRFVLFM